MKKLLLIICCMVLTFSFVFIQNPSNAKAADEFIFGMLMVGPYNDRGWSQAHYEAGKYLEEKLPGVKMIYIDKVNPADRQGVTIPQLVDDLVSKGAKLIIANSDDMKDGTREAALQHPNVKFIHVSGDDVLTGKASKNITNIMGKIEYGKMMAGFAAAMTTKTGKIGFIGPLINEETLRVTNAGYLGARYAWEHVLKRDPADLHFKVTWIGFWFHIPGVTTDPIQVCQNFYDTGHDVIISGLDTTEVLVVGKQKRKEGKEVWAIPFDYYDACAGADDICLGVPYFNWGPAYLSVFEDLLKGKWESQWQWLGPDWNDINNKETTAIGYTKGPALSKTNEAALDKFIAGLGSGEIKLFKGPLYYQDGSTYLKPGEIATDKQIWYSHQLLKGIEGASKAE